MKYAGLFPILHTPFDRQEKWTMSRSGALCAMWKGRGLKAWCLRLLECAGLHRAALHWRGDTTGYSTRIAASARIREARRLRADASRCCYRQQSYSASCRTRAGLTGARLDAEALAELAGKYADLAGIKVDQAPTGPAITAFRTQPRLRDLSYFAGYSGVQWFDAEKRGATALMSGCGHISEDRRLFGDVAAYHRLPPLLNFEMQSLDMAIAVHKRLLFNAGVLATPNLRGPSSDIDPGRLFELHLLTEALRL